MKKKQLTIIGEMWDFVPTFILFDKLYNSKFISYYKPWLKGGDGISNSHIIKLNEKKVSILFLPFKLIRRLYLIQKHIIEFKPDIIISHHDESNIINLILILFNFRNKKLKHIAFIHSGTKEYINSNLYFKFKSFFINHFYNYFDVIFTPSKGNLLSLKNYFNLNNLKVLYNPVDLKYYIDESNKTLSRFEMNKYFNSNHKTFIAVGRLTKQKNYFNLFDSFKKVISIDSNIKLLVLGDGELKSKLENHIKKLNLQNNIFLLGHKKNIYPYLKNSKALILNSLWESFGNVLVESLGVGIPVISRDCESGPREILCPKSLNFSENIKYPFFSNGGVLLTSNIENKGYSSQLENLILNFKKLEFSQSDLSMFEIAEIAKCGIGIEE